MTRLIDADAFKKYIEDGIDGLILPRDQVEKAIAITKGFLKDIDEQPTVERPHGEWEQITEPDIWGKTKYQCSVCKYVHRHSEFDTISFCENCGADMRKEGDDNG